jgi:hypothetical protein
LKFNTIPILTTATMITIIITAMLAGTKGDASVDVSGVAGFAESDGKLGCVR